MIVTVVVTAAAVAAAVAGIAATWSPVLIPSWAPPAGSWPSSKVCGTSDSGTTSSPHC